MIVDEVAPDRHGVAAAGHGEFKPLFANDTPEHQAENRRVEIIIRRKTTAAAPVTAATPPSRAATPPQSTLQSVSNTRVTTGQAAA